MHWEEFVKMANMAFLKYYPQIFLDGQRKLRRFKRVLLKSKLNPSRMFVKFVSALVTCS
jgi:hypothetical protein